jgi:hypothetical protein
MNLKMALPIINDHQRRNYRTSLLLFENSFWQVLPLMDGDETDILYQQTKKLDSKQKATIRKISGDALERLLRLVKKLVLWSEKGFVEKTIVAKMSVWLVNLQNWRSSWTSGYGKLHPEIPEVIDSVCGQLALKAVEINQLISNAVAKDIQFRYEMKPDDKP